MAIHGDDVKKIVIRAAGEESSIYDMICELRPLLIKGNSLNDYQSAIGEAFAIISDFRKNGAIEFYGPDAIHPGSGAENIYTTFAFIPSKSGV
ncbi:MAG: hypothetical protein ACRCTD_02950 [Beijerinckiaceae bacterium]